MKHKELFIEGFYEPVYGESHEENLLLYSVLDAIDSAINNKDDRKADEDLWWLFDELLDEERSFGWYCDLLKWHPETVRAFLRNNWQRISFRRKQLAKIAMGKYPSFVPRVFAEDQRGPD